MTVGVPAAWHTHPLGQNIYVTETITRHGPTRSTAPRRPPDRRGRGLRAGGGSQSRRNATTSIESTAAAASPPHGSGRYRQAIAIATASVTIAQTRTS